jgi:hypothetical protein
MAIWHGREGGDRHVQSSLGLVLPLWHLDFMPLEWTKLWIRLTRSEL